MTRIDRLKHLGFSEKEIKVYTTLLGLKQASVRQLAMASGVNRGTTYDILKSLMREGMTSYFHKEKKQYFVAESPDAITAVIDRRQKKLDDLKHEAVEIIPMLKALYEASDEKPVVKYYEGKRGIRSILNDVLEATQKNGKEYYVYSASDTRARLYEQYQQYSTERVKRGIKVKVIALGAGGELRGLDERKWIKIKEPASTYTIVYAGKVAYLTVDARNELAGVILENQGIYATQKVLFEQLWAHI
ncbi:MAG TPA: hypothetical protein DEF59_00380 [Candidatus Magasanikbacteria bacterium]|nr:hypothetical protein [Candidatus Magasanikbacteria bacterium]